MAMMRKEKKVRFMESESWVALRRQPPDRDAATRRVDTPRLFNALSDEPNADQIEPRHHRHPRRLPPVDRRTLHHRNRAKSDENPMRRRQLLAVIRSRRSLHWRCLLFRPTGNRATSRSRIRTARVAHRDARPFPTRHCPAHRPEGEPHEQENQECQARNHRWLSIRLVRGRRQ